MKLIAVLVLIAAVTGSQAQDVSLRDAVLNIQVALRLDAWSAYWQVERNGDNEVCRYSNDLNAPGVLDQAFVTISADPNYQFLRTEMIAGGVDWDLFIAGELRPAVGSAPLISTCTSM